MGSVWEFQVGYGEGCYGYPTLLPMKIQNRAHDLFSSRASSPYQLNVRRADLDIQWGSQNTGPWLDFIFHL